MLRWDYLDSISEEKAQFWSGSGPTRHVIIDDFLDTATCQKLYDLKGVEKKLKSPLARTHKHVRGKSGTPRPAEMTDLQAQFFEEVNSPEFVKYLEKITGITPLYADPELNGGGVHLTRPGGYLNVHLDFNGHPSKPYNRRLNMLLYLNKEWRDEWNGHIELWDVGLQRPFLKAQPIMNRALLFETSEDSYHGHPLPLKTPPGVFRFSLAVYYYSEWPADVAPRPQTYYQLVHTQWADLFGRIAQELVNGAGSLERVTSAVEVDYQTRDIKVAYDALLGLKSAHDIGFLEWAGVMRKMANKLYEQPLTADEMVRHLSAEHDEKVIRRGYDVLTSIRSAKLVGERYWEYPDGKCSMEGPPEKRAQAPAEAD